MTKMINTASATSTLASSFSTAIADAVRAMISSFRTSSQERTESLPARLRYDLGELDINPDCVRGAAHHAGTSLDREIMRRGF